MTLFLVALWAALCALGVPESLVRLIASFHDGMFTRVRVGDRHTEQIAVNNGQRQGCTISLVLFNLYFALVFEKWRSEVQRRHPDLGIDFRFNINGNLFNNSRTCHQHSAALDVEFADDADDAALMVASREVAESALEFFHSVASAYGLTVNFAKTKFMCCGFGIPDDDRRPIVIDGQSVECVPSFIYLGCLMTPEGRIGPEVDRRLAQASRAFGALRCVFENPAISIRTKRVIYDACVLSVLLYGSESWPVLRRDEDRLDRFHYQYVRAILGVSCMNQETDHITNSELRVRWGNSDLLSDILRRRRMQWLGHVARMPDDRLPKQLLFGWLPQTRPAHGPRLRWKDRVRSDLTLLHVPEWYKSAQERQEWRGIYLPSVDRPAPEPAAHCNTCNRTRCMCVYVCCSRKHFFELCWFTCLLSYNIPRGGLRPPLARL